MTRTVTVQVHAPGRISAVAEARKWLRTQKPVPVLLRMGNPVNREGDVWDVQLYIVGRNGR